MLNDAKAPFCPQGRDWLGAVVDEGSFSEAAFPTRTGLADSSSSTESDHFEDAGDVEQLEVPTTGD